MVFGVDVCGLVYSAQLTEATKAAWGGGLGGCSYILTWGWEGGDMRPNVVLLVF